ncbi:unnamed protein product [Camellia sinensis]
MTLLFYRCNSSLPIGSSNPSHHLRSLHPVFCCLFIFGSAIVLTRLHRCHLGKPIRGGRRLQCQWQTRLRSQLTYQQLHLLWMHLQVYLLWMHLHLCKQLILVTRGVVMRVYRLEFADALILSCAYIYVEFLRYFVSDKYDIHLKFLMFC